jgi:Zn-dependent peptidase ImmA (M78 family)
VRTSREIEAVALKARKEIGLSLGLNETLLRKNLEDKGYFLFYYPFGESGISGALFSSVHARILVVNSSQSIGRQNFTVAHELGHIYLHNTESLVEISGDESSTKEREADTFASMFLMPVNDVSSMIQTNGGIEFDAVEVMEISQMFRMSYKATLKRLTEVFGRKAIPLTLWDKKPLQLAEMLNMDKRLYEPSGEKYWSNTKYVSTAFRALEKGRISFSRFLELMKDIGLNGYDVLENMKESD